MVLVNTTPYLNVIYAHSQPSGKDPMSSMFECILGRNHSSESDGEIG